MLARGVSNRAEARAACVSAHPHGIARPASWSQYSELYGALNTLNASIDMRFFLGLQYRSSGKPALWGHICADVGLLTSHLSPVQTGVFIGTTTPLPTRLHGL